ncbi:MAG: glycosyltransferase family 1 protein [Lachnospiraceae bacterium]|nr:glycosyltransferase family 1 protein [Lachnospiraceae bacterium]
MEEITCHTQLLPPGETRELTFWDILLDDRWAEGNIICSDNIYNKIGNLNYKLHAKQNYEFLLRAVEFYPVKAIGQTECCDTDVDAWEAFRTDCYIIGKYQETLRENGYFDTIVTAILHQAFQMPWKESGISFLENMISRSPVYYEIDDNTRPILLYYGADICLNLLNYFIEFWADAFRKCHQRVEIFDGNSEGTIALTKYIGQRFKAIIGMQTGIFTFKTHDQTTYLHDLIYGPKFNMVFDHPAWLKDALQRAPRDYYLLLHDRNYIHFSEHYFQNISGCIRFPPAGLIPHTPPIPMAERKYDISFIGAYRNYRERLAVLYTYDRTHRHLAAHYLRILRKHPDYTGERALKDALQHFNIQLDDEQFLQLFHDMRQVYFCIFLYYREKVVETLIEAGIPVHIFSERWENSPFKNHPFLICHPEVDAQLSLEIMQNSKISLNIMSWHKDGLTERIFNGMLCQSVVLSDNTTALEEEFTDNRDIALFSLSELSTLPTRVEELLSDNDRLQEIAINGYNKALSRHTWHQRAEQLLEILDH